MIFMSQSGLLDAARPGDHGDWDKWYLEHLAIMSSVKGVDSAQRFKCIGGEQSPSLAMYTLASASVFDDPYYLSVRGMGEWLALIDRRWYRRNLFDGLVAAPQVRDDQRLLVADRAQPGADIAGIGCDWLAAVALDKSTPFRGIAVVDAQIAGRLDPAAGSFGLYRPVTRRFTPQPAPHPTRNAG